MIVFEAGRFLYHNVRCAKPVQKPFLFVLLALGQGNNVCHLLQLASAMDTANASTKTSVKIARITQAVSEASSFNYWHWMHCLAG